MNSSKFSENILGISSVETPVGAATATATSSSPVGHDWLVERRMIGKRV
jgi:hypothetical protein